MRAEYEYIHFLDSFIDDPNVFPLRIWTTLCGDKLGTNLAYPHGHSPSEDLTTHIHLYRTPNHRITCDACILLNWEIVTGKHVWII